MKWKNRLTNYNFWVSIVSAVLLIFQAFDINFDLEYINEIVTAVLGVLVVVGIISDPTKSSGTSATESDTAGDSIDETAQSQTDTSSQSVYKSEEMEISEEKEGENTPLPIGETDETNDDSNTPDMEVFVEEATAQTDTESNSFNIVN